MVSDRGYRVNRPVRVRMRRSQERYFVEGADGRIWRKGRQGIRADLERRGQTIGGYDVLIAGHARSRGLIVVTNNPGEFMRVEGLRSMDWED